MNRCAEQGAVKSAEPEGLPPRARTVPAPRTFRHSQLALPGSEEEMRSGVQQGQATEDLVRHERGLRFHPTLDRKSLEVQAGGP